MKTEVHSTAVMFITRTLTTMKSSHRSCLRRYKLEIIFDEKWFRNETVRLCVTFREISPENVEKNILSWRPPWRKATNTVMAIQITTQNGTPPFKMSTFHSLFLLCGITVVCVLESRNDVLPEHNNVDVSLRHTDICVLTTRPFYSVTNAHSAHRRQLHPLPTSPQHGGTSGGADNLVGTSGH